ncbi:hypothetical protein JCM16303_003150 [Sporobolomyces ruberrimus]
MLGWSAQLGNKLFGQDPKLDFRKPGQGADLLSDPYWNQYLSLFDSPSDVLYLLPNSTLLKTLHQNPQNLLNLLSFITSHLFDRLDTEASSSDRRKKPEEWNKEVLSCVRVLTRLLPLLLGPQNGTKDQVEEEIFWKRPRIVKRRKEEEQGTRRETPAEDEGQGQFVLEDEDEDDEGASTPLASSQFEQSQQDEYEELPCLAERLISTLINLLFVPGLTISSDLGSSDSIVNYSIWEPGIASPFPSPNSPTPPATPNSLLSARLETLRLLTLLISLPSLLTPPNAFTTVPNRFRESLVTGQALLNSQLDSKKGQEKNIILCLLCSLINTACQGGRQDFEDEERGGGGPPSPGGNEGGLRASAARFAAEAARRTQDVALGGNSGSGIIAREDVKNLLVGNCLQLLGIVLIEHAHGDASPSTTTKSINLFEFYLSKLHRTEDYNFLLSGLLHHVYNALLPPSNTILPFSLPLPKNPLDSTNSSTPTSSLTDSKPKSSGWTVESLTVLWRLVEGNRKFGTWLIRSKGEEGNGGSGRLGETIGFLEVVRNEWRGDETQIGLVRLASFLIQSLTAETGTLALESPQHAISLKQSLNNPIKGSQKLKALVRRQCASVGISTGAEDGSITLIEFLITSAHSLILSPSTNKSGRLSTLYPSIVLSIDNLSPYIVELSNDASMRLVRIWLAFSAPSWVLMEEGNPRLIFYLLETFNNMIYNNLALNSRFVHALLQTHKRFELLSQFTLELGVSEARRLRAERRKKQQQASHLEPVKEGEESTSSMLSTRASPRLSISSTFSSTSGVVGAGGATSPTSPGGGDGGETKMSEKAAGKRRERSLSSLGALNLSELSLNDHGGSAGGSSSAAEDHGPFVGKNGFAPTEQWVSSWREGLPLDPILLLLSELSPQIADCPTRTTALDIILSASPDLASLLPTPAPSPRPRRFVLTPPLQTWLASTLYGKIYLSHLDYMRETLPVQLFGVQEAPNMRKRNSGGLAGLEEVGGRVGDFARGVLGRVGGGNK